jgi:hypothetical protein
LLAIALLGWFLFLRYEAPPSVATSPTVAAPVADRSDPTHVASNALADTSDRTHVSDSISVDGVQPQPKLVDVPLSATDRLKLIDAPRVFLNQEPSSALSQAMTYGRVAKVWADRVENSDSSAVQGWIYYSEVAGYTPAVLCISETFPILEWMHCQEHRHTVPIVIQMEH